MVANDLPRVLKNKRVTYNKLSKLLGVHPSTAARWIQNDFSCTNLNEFIKVVNFLEKSGIYDNDYFKILTDDNTYCPKTERTIEQIREDDSRA
jgi:transcriptional regulator with XRE-family HTH domain